MKSMTLLLSILFSTFAVGQQSITVASGEYPPYTAIDLPHGGFVNHIITEAFTREGYLPTFDYLPWERSKFDTRKGKYQAASYWQCTEEHQQSFLCSEPIQQANFVFFYLKSNPLEHWTTLEDLADYHIGLTRGYAYTPALWAAVESGQLKAEVVSRDELNIAKLLRGRIDLLVLEPVVFHSLIRKYFDHSRSLLIDFHPTPLLREQTHLLFPKSRPDAAMLLEIFNRGLRKLKEEGTYERLSEQLIRGYYER